MIRCLGRKSRVNKERVASPRLPLFLKNKPGSSLPFGTFSLVAFLCDPGASGLDVSRVDDEDQGTFCATYVHTPL
jgi:hypothetical protein